jgi:hypothetical protein
MAGGIFADQPFVVNIKCIIISILLMIFYWILPHKNPFMLPIIFITGYIAVAWYDYLYKCNITMYSGTSPVGMATLDAWGKPQRRFEDKQNDERDDLVTNQELVYKKKIYALHALFIAPFIFYVGWYGKKNKVNKKMWSVVGSIAFLVILYHGLRLFYPRDVTSCVDENKNERGTLITVYIIHLLVVAPLLIYVAYYGSSSNNSVWTPTMAMAVIVFLYHGMRYFFPRIVKENC